MWGITFNQDEYFHGILLTILRKNLNYGISHSLEGNVTSPWIVIRYISPRVCTECACRRTELDHILVVIQMGHISCRVTRSHGSAHLQSAFSHPCNFFPTALHSQKMSCFAHFGFCRLHAVSIHIC